MVIGYDKVAVVVLETENIVIVIFRVVNINHTLFPFLKIKRKINPIANPIEDATRYQTAWIEADEL